MKTHHLLTAPLIFMEMTQTADIAHVRRKEHFGDGKGNYMWG